MEYCFNTNYHIYQYFHINNYVFIQVIRILEIFRPNCNNCNFICR